MPAPITTTSANVSLKSAGASWTLALLPHTDVLRSKLAFMAGLLLGRCNFGAPALWSHPAVDPLAKDILDRWKGPLRCLGDQLCVRASAWISELGHPNSGQVTDDDTPDHAGVLMRDAEVVVDSLDGQGEGESLVGQQVIRVPRLGPIRDAMGMLEVLRVVSRRGVGITR